MGMVNIRYSLMASKLLQSIKIIGVSLSEPHTSVTSLHICLLACLDQPLTENLMGAYFNITTYK